MIARELGRQRALQMKERANAGSKDASAKRERERPKREEGKEEETYGNLPLCPTGHRPFGAAASMGGLHSINFHVI